MAQGTDNRVSAQLTLRHKPKITRIKNPPAPAGFFVAQMASLVTQKKSTAQDDRRNLNVDSQIWT
jgi:hypothetical protein